MTKRVMITAPEGVGIANTIIAGLAGLGIPVKEWRVDMCHPAEIKQYIEGISLPDQLLDGSTKKAVFNLDKMLGLTPGGDAAVLITGLEAHSESIVEKLKSIDRPNTIFYYITSS